MLKTGFLLEAGSLHGNPQINGIYLDGTTSGMGGLGENGGGEAALNQIQHDPVGIAGGGTQRFGKLADCDFVRSPVMHYH